MKVKKYAACFLATTLLTLLAPPSILAAGLAVTTNSSLEGTASITETDTSAHKFTVTYTDASGGDLTAGNWYVLLIVNGTLNNLTADKITYIDQATAADTGDGHIAVSFTGLIPRYLPDSTLYLGGGAAPIVLGSFKAATSTVSGKVTFIGNTSAATVSLLDGSGKAVLDGSGKPIAAATDINGNYTLTAPENCGYELKITKKSYLSYTKTDVLLSGGTALPSVDIRQMAGDLDGVNGVNYVDLTTLLQDFGKSSTDTNVIARGTDIDGVNGVNVADLTTLLQSFGKTNVIN